MDSTEYRAYIRFIYHFAFPPPVVSTEYTTGLQKSTNEIIWKIYYISYAEWNPQRPAHPHSASDRQWLLKGYAVLAVMSPHDNDAIIGAGYAMLATLIAGADVYMQRCIAYDCRPEINMSSYIYWIDCRF